MARRWRIRHKLMLGLTTAIAILVVLLAGIFHSLWSYYVAVKTIDAKLVELDRVEELKASVVDLRDASLYNRLAVAQHYYKALPDLEARIDRTEVMLDRYEEHFLETVRRELNPQEHVGHLTGMLKKIHEQLTGLREEARREVQLVGAQPAGTRMVAGPLVDRCQEIQKRARELEQTSADLRTSVRDHLDGRIKTARRNYMFIVVFLITASALSLILMLSALRFFFTWIVHPIHDLQSGVGRVAKGDFDHRIQVDSGDEMEELATAFNDMTERLQELYRDMARQINERSRQLVRSERLASVGYLAAGVAHEINNPLASIAFSAEALEARLEEFQEQARALGRTRKDFDIFTKYLNMIQQEAFRCKNITERLLEFSRGGERKREQTDLGQLVQSVLDVAQHLPNSRGKTIHFARPAPVLAWISTEEIKSVVLNLVANALESMEEGGQLQVALSAREGRAEMEFRDSGCGMTAEVLENIFEPFFTRNRTGKGTGLGLTITHKIISQHGGEIEASSAGTNCGSTFRVRLPLGMPENGKRMNFPDPLVEGTTSPVPRDRAA